MKLTDYVIDFLVKRGTTHVYGMSGGAAVHLFDSSDRHPGMQYVCSQHEQSSAMSADGYSRVTGKMGVAITTSGPGATNLLTGVCCSYYDSVPTLMLTGQVSTPRLKGDRPIRQYGFQETDVVSIYSTVTKYAHQISDPDTIRFHLEKAFYLAFEGRPGPVLIDIPDDLQRAEVDPDTMEGFEPDLINFHPIDNAGKIDQLIGYLRDAERPLVVLGGGLSTPRVDDTLMQVLERMQVPVLVTWAGSDLIPYNHPLRVGPFGVYGPRLGNFAVQNADLLLTFGSRLSQNMTGGILPSFAQTAKIVMVDASPGEMDKFDGRGIEVDLRISARLDEFLPLFRSALKRTTVSEYYDWKEQINHWRKTLPNDRPEAPSDEAGFVDAYEFVDKLSDFIPEGESVFVDTGGNLTWTCNGLRLKKGQRLISAWNNTPMGYALPAAIGAASYQAPKFTTCITGDGGMALCLGELPSVSHYQLPIRIFLFNNHCHGIQKQTLETWLGGNYVGVSPDSGLSFPDFEMAAKACGLKTVTINKTSKISDVLAEVYSELGPIFCNVEIDPDQKLYPVLKFGAALEDQLPSLGENFIESQMVLR